MTNELAIQPNEPSAIQLAGAAANASAARYVFEDYRRKRADNTTRRQRADLELLTRYLGSVGVLNAALDQDTKEAATNRRQYAEQYQNDPDTWRGMTWGLIAGFVRWQMQ